MSNMADAAAIRREARKRKILENSQNRLQIISGKSSDECFNVSPIGAIIPEPEYDFSATASTSSYGSTSQQNGLLFSPPPELFEFLSAPHNIDAAGDGELVNDLASLLPPGGLLPSTSEPIEVPTSTIWEKIIINKYDIVLLSLVLQSLYSFSLITIDNSYFFLPVIVYIVTKLIWFPSPFSSNFASVLMLLSGISPARASKISYMSQCLGIISRDIFVYLFTTICGQAFWNMITDFLIT